MRHEKPERAAARRRTTRAEVDEFAPGPRLPDGGRGGFETAHSDASPGGTSGEHSGQRLPPRGTHALEAGDDEGGGDEDEAPETPLDEPPPVPIVDPPSDATPAPPMSAAAPFLDRIEVAVGELSDRPASNAMLVTDIIQAVNGLRSLLGANRSH
jgi:hypothetical protein